MDKAAQENTGTLRGLSYWMRRVPYECDRASQEFAAEPVHDLRVALRRCRSMADGFIVMDPDPAWKEMKKACKQLFQSLGALRDTQVMLHWVQRLGAPEDSVRQKLVAYLTEQELRCQAEAAEGLRMLNRKQWLAWSRSLSQRARRIPRNGQIFKHLALERWHEAQALHRQGMRSQSRVAFHRLRIGIKHFRYTVENFLPKLHETWSNDLKAIQDCLGEIHDLDVLWVTALGLHAFPDTEARLRWRERIEAERSSRLECYRSKMAGSNSLWAVWRCELPQGAAIEKAALSRMQVWAAALDPDFEHAKRVCRLAQQLHQGFLRRGYPEHADGHRARSILQAAALMHDVGRSTGEKNHHKSSYRMIRKLSSPLGWTAEDMQRVATVARYHRGALPRAQQRALRTLTEEQKPATLFLCGVLRLADALDWQHEGKIQQVQVETINPTIVIKAQGYVTEGALAQRVAWARHLLEIRCGRPVLVQPA